MSNFLCDGQLMIFIGGHGSNEESSRASSFFLTQRMRENGAGMALHDVKFVINKAGIFTTSEELIRRIRNIIKTITPCSEGGISVIFVHSLGAKVLNQVLTAADSQLNSSQIAVFSFGGADIIPNGIAKVAANFVFDIDSVAWAASHTIGQTQPGARVITLNSSPETQRDCRRQAITTASVAFSASAAASNFSRNPTSHGFITSLLQSINLSINVKELADKLPHYMENYLQSDEAFSTIWEDLGINRHGSRRRCRCIHKNKLD